MGMCLVQPGKSCHITACPFSSEGPSPALLTSWNNVWRSLAAQSFRYLARSFRIMGHMDPKPLWRILAMDSGNSYCLPCFFLGRLISFGKEASLPVLRITANGSLTGIPPFDFLKMDSLPNRVISFSSLSVLTVQQHLRPAGM